MAEPAEQGDGDVEQPLLDDHSGEHDAEQRGTSWLLTSSMLVAEMLGIGALSLPSAFARLGWAASVAVIGLGGAGMAFSGLLFAKLGVQVPKARTFDALGTAAYGRRGRALVYMTAYWAVAGAPALLQLTSASSLQQILAPWGWTHWQAGLLVLGVIILLGQIRGLEHVSILSTAGTIGMLTAMTIVCIKLLLLPAREPGHSPKPASGSSLGLAVVATMDIAFAYGGQQNFASYLSAMPARARGDFAKSVGLGSVVLTLSFLAVGAIGYHKLGTDFDQTQPITAALPQDAVFTPLMNGGVLLHCILAYQIDLNVFCSTALHLLCPSYAEAPARTASLQHRRLSSLIWAGTTVAGALLAFGIAAALPFFSTVMGLVAAVGDLSAAYLLPALFCLVLLPSKLTALQKWLCRALVPLSVLLTLLGAWTSGVQLWAELHHQEPVGP